MMISRRSLFGFALVPLAPGQIPPAIRAAQVYEVNDASVAYAIASHEADKWSRITLALSEAKRARMGVIS